MVVVSSMVPTARSQMWKKKRLLTWDVACNNMPWGVILIHGCVQLTTKAVEVG